MRTGYYTHPDCTRHEMGRDHPECPARLSAIEDRLISAGLDWVLQRMQAPLADEHQLELAHSALYLAELRSRGAVEDGYAWIDPDTLMNPHTLSAALRAAGAAIAATDAVLDGEIDNAFCAVRPPGHHATRDRAMGFCFINNVAVAARHALDRRGLQRVAVVDFDVHHGNGT
ncbi:MAG: histone deacetylase family protein, partial [Betaproteobacteria bacterium]|nr:histone deacetylase family protein [Betaproteobacteria bacterium]